MRRIRQLLQSLPSQPTTGQRYKTDQEAKQQKGAIQYVRQAEYQYAQQADYKCDGSQRSYKGKSAHTSAEQKRSEKEALSDNIAGQRPPDYAGDGQQPGSGSQFTSRRPMSDW